MTPDGERGGVRGATDRLNLRFVLPGVWVAGLGLACIPAVFAAILSFDLSNARAMNSLFGAIPPFDRAVGWINSQSGDRAVGAFFLCFFGMHTLAGKGRAARLDRAAFWLWTALIFVVLYLCEHIVEGAIGRYSPGKVLDGWFNLRKEYGVKAKVDNLNCFPSGHAMAYWLFALTAIRRYRKAGSVLIALALVVPTTRIATGAHWFSDIFLGSLPVAATAAAFAMETQLWGFKLAIEGRLAGTPLFRRDP